MASDNITVNRRYRRNSGRKRFLAVVQGVIILGFLAFIIIMVSARSSKNVPMDQIENVMSSQQGISELVKKDDRAVSYFFGVCPDQCLYYKSDNIMDVRELFIVKTSDAAEMEMAAQAAASRLERQIENFTGYGTDQLEKLQHAITMQKGDYYFYAVGDEADEWQEAFLKIL